MKPGDIEYDENKNILSLVTIGDSERDAVVRAEEFIRVYFSDDSSFVGNVEETVRVGTTAGGGVLYKVVSY